MFCLLWNPKVHYYVHKITPLVHVLSKMHLVDTLPPNFPKILSNIILASRPRSSTWSRNIEKMCVCVCVRAHMNLWDYQ